MTIYNELIIACWAVFIGYWFISALDTKQTVRGTWGRGITLRLGFFVVVILLFQIPAVDQFFKSHQQVSQSPLWSAVAVALTALGIGLAVWARMHLGRNWGMPMSEKAGAEIITTGPYSLIRHPIYTGVITAILGSAIVAGLWWFIIFIFGAIYFFYSATKEEERMVERFPTTYPAYQARTKMLIPFIF